MERAIITNDTTTFSLTKKCRWKHKPKSQENLPSLDLPKPNPPLRFAALNQKPARKGDVLRKLLKHYCAYHNPGNINAEKRKTVN